jgi:hypothetical protein
VKGQSCDRETSAKERMMVLLCEQELHLQTGANCGSKIIETAVLKTSKLTVKY